MSSKRQRGEGSSSKQSKPYDKKKFISVEASDKFKAWENHPFIPERGLEPDAHKDGELAQMIAERGWFKLTAQPEVAVAPIVREFYANLQENHFRAVNVRGYPVSVFQTDINTYFQLTAPKHRSTEYADFAGSEPDYERIVQELCEPGTKWTVKGRGAMTFPKSSLSRYGKAWHAFLSARLMPSSHYTDVTKDRAVLLYSIVTGMQIDVGKVIQSSIHRFLRGGATTGGFPHPTLITELCFLAGVRWSDNAVRVPPAPVIDHALIMRYKVWTGADQNPRGLGYIMVQQGEASTADRRLLREIRGLQRQIDDQHQEVLRENTRLAERQDVISQNNNQFQAALVDMFGRLNPGAGPFTFPVPHPMPVFPPEESSADESDNEEGSDNA